MNSQSHAEKAACQASKGNLVHDYTLTGFSAENLASKLCHHNKHNHCRRRLLCVRFLIPIPENVISGVDPKLSDFENIKRGIFSWYDEYKLYTCETIQLKDVSNPDSIYPKVINN